jgi:hypothetical protein
LKAKIYQYTGIYLAYKEDVEYLTSDLFWAEFITFRASHPDYSYQEIQDFLLVTREGYEDFHRGHTRMSRMFIKNPSIFYSTLDWLVVFFRTLNRDIKKVFKNVLRRNR